MRVYEKALIYRLLIRYTQKLFKMLKKYIKSVDILQRLVYSENCKRDSPYKTKRRRSYTSVEYCGKGNFSTPLPLAG